METQKEKGLDTRINESKKQENRVTLVRRACGCGRKSQALEIVCDLKKKKEKGRVGRK